MILADTYDSWEILVIHGDSQAIMFLAVQFMWILMHPHKSYIITLSKYLWYVRIHNDSHDDLHDLQTVLFYEQTYI